MKFYRSTAIVAGMSSLLIVYFCYWSTGIVAGMGCRQYKGDIEVKLNKPRQSLLQLKQYNFVTNMIYQR